MLHNMHGLNFLFGEEGSYMVECRKNYEGDLEKGTLGIVRFVGGIV